MPTPLWKATVRAGTIIVDRELQSDFNHFLMGMEGDVVLTVKRPVKDRSNQQNKYYFKVVVGILSEMTGYSKEEMHDALREKFLSEMSDSHGLTRIRSTTDLSTVEFESYLSNIRQWASVELDCFIPDPNSAEY